MWHSFFRRWFNYIESQRKRSIAIDSLVQSVEQILWGIFVNKWCRWIEKEPESERQTERDGAPVAVVISSSHIAGTDAFVSPLLSDQDNSIYFYLFYFIIFWTQTYLNGFILNLDYYFFHWIPSDIEDWSKKFVYTIRKCCSIFSEHFFSWTYIHNLKTQISHFPSIQSLQRVCHTWIWREPLTSTVS